MRLNKMFYSLFLIALMNKTVASSLFTTGFMGASSAGIFNVASSPGTSQTVLTNNLIFYSGSTCGGAPTCNLSSSGSSGFTFNPGAIVNVSASSVYLFYEGACGGASVQSVYITPYYANNPTAYIFVPNPGHGGCFPVICSSSSQTCIGSATVNVTLM